MFATALSLLAAAAALSASPGTPQHGAELHWSAAAAQGVVRVPLPAPGRRLVLPAIAGPADGRRPLVVIDPGHGGVDRGAVASDQQDEKTLALGLARALRDELVARGRIRVALTRDADRLLTLEERAGTAAKLGADLFVSIHLMPGTAPADGGLSVTTRADRASDAAAERTAAAENGVDRARGILPGGSRAAAAGDAGPLNPRQVSERSTVFANLVIRESRGRLRLHARPRRQAPLTVLAGLAAPAVLIEAGSVGNGEDATALASAAGRASFARAVTQAIEAYFARLPPER